MSGKSMAKLIEEIERLQARIRSLQTSMEVYEDEAIKKISALETSQDHLQGIIDNIEDPIIVIDTKYRISFANRKVRAIAGGIDPVEAGLYCYQVSHRSESPCKGKLDPCPLTKILRTKKPVTLTHTHFDCKDCKIIVEISAAPIFDKSGNVTHIIEVCRDITKRTKMENALRESETRYRSLFEQSSDAIFVLGIEGKERGKILSANKAACIMHGYTEQEILNRDITDLDTEESSGRAQSRLKRILSGSPLRFEAVHERKDGSIFPVEVSASLMKIGDEKFILAIDHDISDRNRAEKERTRFITELKYMSQIDGLTGLSNRQHLDSRLSEEIRRAGRYENPLSLIMFDIDKFKYINDTYGHLAGDKILLKTATIVNETLRDTDIAGRFGGDEFVLILVQTPLSVGMQVAERIRSKIEKTKVHVKKNQFVRFTVSIGICQLNNKIKNSHKFIAQADKAMYRAKKEGLNRVCKNKN